MERESTDDGAVLIPSGGKMKSYACLRSLGRRGVPTVVASEFASSPLAASRWCGERVRLSTGPDDLLAYRDELLELASRSDIGTIVPVRECDTYLFAKYRDEFEAVVSLVSPELDTLRVAHDRLRLAEAAAAAGVPYIETTRLSDVREWTSDVVVKSRYNVLTDEYVDALSPSDCEEVKTVRFLPAGDHPDPTALRAELRHDPIVQPFVHQTEKHLYCGLWDDGEPLSTYQHRQIRRNSWVGGGGVYRVSAYSVAVEQAAYDLLSHLDWTGFACIEYVKDAATGEWKFLEINPRLWQSLPEAVRAGVDFPFHYWLHTQDRTDEIEDDYETGIACHNAYGELGHLLSLFRDSSPFEDRPSVGATLWDTVTSCLASPRFDYIRRDDPRVALGALRQALSTGVTRSRQYGDGSPASQTGSERDRRSQEPRSPPLDSRQD